MRRALARLPARARAASLSTVASASPSCSGFLVAVEARGRVHVIVEPRWADAVSASAPGAAPGELVLEDAPGERLVSVVLARGSRARELRVVVPQRADVHVDAGDGAGDDAGGADDGADAGAGGITVLGKLEGALTLRAARGDVVLAGSVRGARVELAAARGAVRVGRSLDAGEAALSGAAGVAARRVSAASVRVDAGGAGVALGALYATDARLRAGAGAALRVGSLHGAAAAEAAGAGPRVSVRGVTGALDLRAPARDAAVHFDAPRGASRLAAGGDASVTFARPAAVALRARGARGVDAPPLDAAGVLRAGEDGGAAGGAGAGGAGAGGDAARVSGGSGKVREGGAVAGFYDEAARDAARGADAELPSVEVDAGGRATVEVVGYGEAVMRAAADARAAAGA
jgi:hypothetical protein